MIKIYINLTHKSHKFFGARICVRILPLESDSKVEVVVDAEDAPEEDGPLGDDDGDEHGEGDGREAVSPQEGHQEAEPAKQHHVNVQRRCKVGKSGW